MHAVIQTELPIIPVWIWGCSKVQDSQGASWAWRSRSLQHLQQNLQALNSRLIIRTGNAASELFSLAKQTGARQIYCNIGYEPPMRQQQEKIRQELSQQGIELLLQVGGSLLWDPSEISTNQNTPYFKKCLASPVDFDPLPQHRALPSPYLILGFSIQ